MLGFEPRKALSPSPMKGTATSREERGTGDTAQPRVALMGSGVKVGLPCHGSVLRPIPNVSQRKCGTGSDRRSFVLLLRHRQMALATKLMAVPMAPVDYPGITSRDSSRGWTHHWPELGGHVGGRRLKITGFQGAGALGLAESLLG